MTAAKHPNRIPFEGILTRLDQPSDKAPSGSRGHRVLLTTAAAEEALPTLIGMAVGFKADWEGHDARNKCGVITAAEIADGALLVRGHIYGHDFPEVVRFMENNAAMGMSYEMIDVHVADMRSSIWQLTRVTFTGAAILLSDKAAYRSSRFRITAAEDVFTGRLSFDLPRTLGKVQILRTARRTRSSAGCSLAPRLPRG